MTDPTNDDRRALADTAVRAYQQATGVDDDAVLQDLLSDLRHWADRRSAVSYDAADGWAAQRYRAELLDSARYHCPECGHPTRMVTSTRVMTYVLPDGVVFLNTDAVRERVPLEDVGTDEVSCEECDHRDSLDDFWAREEDR